MRDWEMGAGSRVAKGVAVAVSSSCSICLSQSEIRNAGHVVFSHRVGREVQRVPATVGGGGICSDSASIIDKRSIWRLRAAPGANWVTRQSSQLLETTTVLGANERKRMRRRRR